MLTLHIRLSLVLEGRPVAGRKCKKIWLVLEGRGFDADPIYRAVARPRGTGSSQKDEGLVPEGRGFCIYRFGSNIVFSDNWDFGQLGFRTTGISDNWHQPVCVICHVYTCTPEVPNHHMHDMRHVRHIRPLHVSYVSYAPITCIICVMCIICVICVHCVRSDMSRVAYTKY